MIVPTSTQVKIAVAGTGGAPGSGGAMAVFVVEGSKNAEDAKKFGPAAARAAERLLKAGVARGKPRQVVFDLLESSGKIRRLYVVGLGPAAKATAETIRQSAAALLRAARKHRIDSLAIVPPDAAKLDAAASAAAVTTGILLAAFDFREYKGTGQKQGDGDEPAAKQMTVKIVAGANRRSVAAAVERAKIVCDAQNLARTIASRPANNINPPSLARIAVQLARESRLKCRVLDEKQLARLGMGGILAVGAGSIATPPRLIVLEYKPASAPKNRKPLLVVGKTVTFDTGGISIKPADKMGKMIFDKCGGMAVLGLMVALAKLKALVHVVGILSAAENAISSKAYRPGDILKLYNGVTVEVTNTDAEGRLVLGDALAWGIEKYRPAAVVDLATLTGGVVVALGKTMAGVMSNSDALVAELESASELAGEKIWRLPLGEDQRDYIKSDMADIVNSGGREGHPLQGGAFLSFFVPRDDSVPWAHLDIAGVADTEKELPYYAKGATGWGVRTMVNWVMSRGKK